MEARIIFTLYFSVRRISVSVFFTKVSTAHGTFNLLSAVWLNSFKPGQMFHLFIDGFCQFAFRASTSLPPLSRLGQILPEPGL
jgi:hypothetical protein